ncbi:hypothetical protein KM043_001863 [Ampulex compressa]|nr:hypothetical protein KM043_001863 [Ampulex compressa]
MPRALAAAKMMQMTRPECMAQTRKQRRRAVGRAGGRVEETRNGAKSGRRRRQPGRRETKGQPRTYLLDSTGPGLARSSKMREARKSDRRVRMLPRLWSDTRLADHARRWYREG